MGSVRQLFVCAVCWCFLLCDFSSAACSRGEDQPPTGGLSEPRARHRLQLLFPLLLRISSRLATLVPTALMSLLGIIFFVVFSKKALLISLIALFFSLSDKYKGKNEEIHVHKLHSYEDYNDEEHIHYHHGPKYHHHHHGHVALRRNHARESLPVLPHIPHPIPLRHGEDLPFRPLKPLPWTSPTGEEGEEGSLRESEEWNSLERSRGR